MHSPFPVGWPALLGVGEAMGIAAWVNPVLVALVPWLLFRLGLHLGGEAVGTRAAFVGAMSPGLLMLGASRMAHTSVLVALGALMLVVLEQRWSARRIALGGLMAAYVALARPFDAALLAAPLLLLGLRGMRFRQAWVWLGLPATAALVVLWDNWSLTGDAFRFPMSAWYDAWQERQGCNALGFGPNIGCAPTLGSFGHTPAKALSLLAEAWVRFDGLLLGVHGGSALAAWGAWRMRARWGVVWVAIIAVGYAMYWSPGRAYGARFWHPMYLVVPIAMAVALRSVPVRWVGVGCAAASLWCWAGILPDLSDRYWCVDGELRDELKAAGIEEGVVFLMADGQRSASWPALGVERFQCDPMLEAGDGWALVDPSRMRGGLQVRHALRDPADAAEFMRVNHPGVAAYLVRHDVENDARTIHALGVPDAR